MNKLTVKEIAFGGIIAAVYVVVSLILMPISFSVYQVRIAEAMTILPFLTRAAIPGLFIGCFLANIFGGMGWLDIIFGSILTLLAAFGTRYIHLKMGDTKLAMTLAPLPPVLFNALGVSIYLAPLLGFNYWFAVQMIGIGQLISCYIIGLPMLIILKKRNIFI